MDERVILHNVEPLPEDVFHATFMQALSRLIARHGDARVALWLGVSRRHLLSIKGGTLPSADKIWNLLAYDRSAHDEIDRRYGACKVSSSAKSAAIDPVAHDMATLLTLAIEAESPDSPGGRDVTLHEILAMPQHTLREVHRTLGSWIERLDVARTETLSGEQR